MMADKSGMMWSDPAIVAGDVYKLVMENDKIRVFDVRFQPGQKAAMHGHPNHLVYVLSGGDLKLTFPDGQSQEVSLTPGQSLWMDAGPHETVNIGTTEAHNLVIELK